AHARQHRAHAVAGDDGHPDLAAGGFEHPARRERLEAVAGEPAVQHYVRLRPVDPAKSEIAGPPGPGPQRLGQRRAERTAHDRDLARQADLERRAGQAGRHRVAGEIALGQHEVAGTAGVLARGGPPPVAAAAGAADEQHAHAGLPEDPERLPLARMQHGIFVDHLPVRRNAQELAAARAAVVLYLGPETVGRERPGKAEPRVAARGREFVEAIAQAPGRAAAERRDDGARAGVAHAWVHGRAHRGSVTSPAWILQGNRLRLRSSWRPEEAL